MSEIIVVSHFQARPLIEARERGADVALTSLDLGREEVQVRLETDGVRMGGGIVPWPVIEEIAESDTACFAIEDGEARKIQTFSEETGRVYTLYPTAGAPTMLVSGVPMHRIKGINPLEDTRRKLRTIAPVVGRVLDTATGLGYTAMEAAPTASSVLTVELDPAAQVIARANPWSRELFEEERIERRYGDSFEVVRELADASFDRVIHDPPMFSLAGELYSLEFYRELHRVTAPGGRLFHYVGDPESRSGTRVTRGVLRRLEEAGFRNLRRRPEAFGVSASR
ncbi:MAG: methyltransferase domain-containing protein [Chloroflexi bacterium]|nr:methyltransferase domain-containing protein [Chloroflexota bacterium]